MRVGLALPQMGPLAEPHRIAEFARTAEDLGYDSLWVGDRALTPLRPDPVYPGFTPEQPWPPEQARFVDPIVALTAAASATHRVRLGTSTLNAVWHSPLLLGRSLTSLDLLSRGRLDAGFGIGWMRTEYQALGVPWRGRAARLEEIIHILRAMWTSDPVEYAGEIWEIPPSALELRPFQPDGPPILLSAFTPAALTRVGHLADGWLPATSVSGGAPFDLLGQLWQVITESATSAGRDPAALRRELRINTSPGTPVDAAVPLLHAARGTGYDGAFVDLSYIAQGVDDALDLATRALDRYRKG